MSFEGALSRDRSRFLVVHDASVSVEQCGPFRDTCMALTDRGADVHVIQADAQASPESLARDAVACQGYDAVAVAGVAETIAGVAAGLAHSHVPLAILPSEQTRELAGQLGLRGKPQAIAEILATGPAALCPGGLVNGTPFRTMVGIGTDPKIVTRLSRHVRPAASKGKSSVMLAKNLIRRVERFDAVVDGMNYRCCCLFVMRTDGFGALTGTANVKSDMAGPLSVVLVEADDRVALFDVLWLAKIGRLFQNNIVNVRRCQHVQVPGGQDLAFECDGRMIADAGFAASGFQMVADPSPVQMVVAADVAEKLAAVLPQHSAAAA